VWLADLGRTTGSEQGGVRPVMIISNDIGNRYSPTVIVAAVTGQSKKYLPTHAVLEKGQNQYEQTRTRRRIPAAAWDSRRNRRQKHRRREGIIMREQTRRNIHYLIGLSILIGLAARLGWDEAQFEAARGELARRFEPTLVEV
jgi:hypothetical protein